MDRHFAVIVTGLAIFCLMLVLPAPAGLSAPAWSAAALSVLMVMWWVSEALPLAATALLPLVLVPMLGLGSIESVAIAYAHPLIFLFLGGFFFAQSLQHWGIHQRIASQVLSNNHAGLSGLVASLMAVTAFLSLWISNTATAMLMIPIAQSLGQAFSPGNGGTSSESGNPAATLLVLSVAHVRKNVPTNKVGAASETAELAAYLASEHNIHIGFGQWMLLGLPVSLALGLITWLLLTRIVYRRVCQAQSSVTVQTPVTDTLSTPACRVAVIGTITGAALVLHPLVQWWWPAANTHDAVIVLVGALLLFGLPDGLGRGRLLQWEQAKQIRWDVLLLFGGGLALAQVITSSELANVIGQWFELTADWPALLAIALVMFVVVLVGELASNTAIAAIVLPIAGAAAISQQVPIISLVLPVGLVASLGFMLPVATPPNAIAYGTGQITMRQMVSAGALLDLISIPIVWALVVTIGYWLFLPASG